mgnify:CR=1 FL=1
MHTVEYGIQALELLVEGTVLFQSLRPLMALAMPEAISIAVAALTLVNIGKHVAELMPESPFAQTLGEVTDTIQQNIPKELAFAGLFGTGGIGKMVMLGAIKLMKYPIETAVSYISKDKDLSDYLASVATRTGGSLLKFT